MNIWLGHCVHKLQSHVTQVSAATFVWLVGIPKNGLLFKGMQYNITIHILIITLFYIF